MNNTNFTDIKGKNAGMITTFFSEQILSHDYEILPITFKNYEKQIVSSEIDVLFIDNDIYEEDHEWHGRPLENIIEFSYDRQIEIIVIKNSTKELQNNNKISTVVSFEPDIQDDNDSGAYGNVQYHNIPLLLNERFFNPINAIKRLDILYLSFDNDKKSPHTKLFLKNGPIKYEDLNLDKIGRCSLLRLVDKVKESKVLYINYSNNIDDVLLKYIEYMSILMDTFVVFDFNFKEAGDYGYNAFRDSTNIAKMDVLLRSQLYKDKYMIRLRRRIFLENTLLIDKSLSNLIEGASRDHRPKVSIITSTNRKRNIENYLKQIARQNGVEVQVVLLTHGFELTDHEQKHLLKSYKLNITFLNADDSLSLGECLNKCLLHAEFDTVAKMDDDDFYLPYYLSDQVIALSYSQADVVGKLSQFIYMESENLVVKRLADEEYKYQDIVMGATIVSSSDYLKRFMFSELYKAEDTDLLKRIKEANGKIYANHPYDFCIYRSKEKGNHTWKVADLALMKASEIICYGKPEYTIASNAEFSLLSEETKRTPDFIFNGFTVYSGNESIEFRTERNEFYLPIEFMTEGSYAEAKFNYKNSKGIANIELINKYSNKNARDYMKYEVLVNDKVVLKEDISLWNLKNTISLMNLNKGDAIRIRVTALRDIKSQSWESASSIHILDYEEVRTDKNHSKYATATSPFSEYINQ